MKILYISIIGGIGLLSGLGILLLNGDQHLFDKDSFQNYFLHVQENTKTMNFTEHDLKLINMSGEISSIDDIVANYPDVSVSVITNSTSQIITNQPNVYDVVKYAVTRISKHPDQTTEFDFSVLFDSQDKILGTLLSCGGHVGTTISNPNKEDLQMCFKIVS